MKNWKQLFIPIMTLITLPFRNKKDKSSKPNNSPIKIGHRGAAGYCPENTMTSFRKAVKLGADYLEIDIQLSKDGEFVVIHDPTVDRTTNGKGKVRSFTFEELRQLDAGSWFHSNFKGERIPSLKEVLQEFGGKIGLLIELKEPSMQPGIEEMLVDELIKYGLHDTIENNIVIQSFDKISMKKIKEFLPSLPVGILVKYHPKGIRQREIQEIATFATYLNPKIPLVNEALVRKIHQAGLKTCPWTVRSPREAKKLKALPVDGIITDFLDYL